MKVKRQTAAMSRRQTTIVGVFDDLLLVDQAVSELSMAGFNDTQIGVAPGLLGSVKSREAIEGAIPKRGDPKRSVG